MRFPSLYVSSWSGDSGLGLIFPCPCLQLLQTGKSSKGIQQVPGVEEVFKPSKFINNLFIIIAVLLTGTLGYMAIEGWKPLDALYMTAITMSTIGYGEVHTLHDAGRIFTIVLIVLSIGAVTYSVGNVMGYIVEGKLNKYFKVRRMEKYLSGLKNHFIVCGAGRTGHAIMGELSEAGVPFVVISKDTKVVEQLRDKKIVAVLGDSGSDEILNQVRVQHAKRVIVVHANDSDNLFTVLTARQLNPDVYIVARALEKENEQKLLKCGANIAVSTSEIGGHRLASIALNPSINSFLDVVQKRSSKIDAMVSEYDIRPGCHLIGKSQASADIRRLYGVTVLGILRDRDNIFNPGPDECFQVHDTLLVFGSNEQINQFRNAV